MEGTQTDKPKKKITNSLPDIKLRQFTKEELDIKNKSRKAAGVNEIRGSLNKFPDFFRMGAFIDSTHMKL